MTMKRTELWFCLAVSSICVLPMALVNCGGRVAKGPCDIYRENGTPCVAAHSTTRRLLRKYDGPLYQVERESDGQKMDIPQTADGYADAAVQNGFCRGTVCRITVIYDQTANRNDLVPAAPGTFKGPDKGGFNESAIADMAPVIVNGHATYGVYIMPGMGYRDNDASNLAINDEPEGIYYVVDGTHYDSGCCFDYGNSSTNGKAVGRGTMETTYYGTSTNWGSGNGNGPWIMADMEAGLFSGFNAKKNDVPSITDWRFVSVFVNGGGGNQWDLRGGNANSDSLTTFYSGVRPEVRGDDNYFPMHRKGAVLMGNGGDNGNGSAGTFYEGVMTQGYPTDKAVNAVQKNIAEQHYAQWPLSISRINTMTPGSKADFTITLANVFEKPIQEVEICCEMPYGWRISEGDLIPGAIQPGKSVTMHYTLESPDKASAGYVEVKAKTSAGEFQLSRRVRSVEQVRINEIGLSGFAGSQQSQFIELYNGADHDVDISGWQLKAQRSGWAAVTAFTVPAGTLMAPQSFYTVSLAANWTAAPARKGSDRLFLGQFADHAIKAGDRIRIDGSEYTVLETGVPAGEFSTIFIPVSTGPKLEIPAGSTNIPVTSAAGLDAGQYMGIDLGGNCQTVRITEVGKPALQTTLAAEAHAGDTEIQIESTENLQPGSELTVSTGQRKETVHVKSILKAASAPAGRRFGGQPHEPGSVELEQPLKGDHINGVDISCRGTGVTFEPALEKAHISGDAIQPLGTEYVLDRPLEADVSALTAVIKLPEKPVTAENRLMQGAMVAADAYFGYQLSTQAGMVALYCSESSDIPVDAIVYGSQQSNSSANGTIAQPSIAVLEGDQGAGGCIAVAPSMGFGGRRGGPVTGEVNGPMIPVDNGRSMARYPDGNDTDMLCVDFKASSNPTPGARNQR